MCAVCVMCVLCVCCVCDVCVMCVCAVCVLCDCGREEEIKPNEENVVFVSTSKAAKHVGYLY